MSLATWELALAGLLWISVALVAYAYVGYPLLVHWLARQFGRRLAPPSDSSEPLPTVSLVVAALNEEKWIAERVLNGLDQDYPPERLRVVVASDGSTDRTCQIVRDLAARYPGRVVLYDFAERRGKATVLNSVLPELTSEIVALSDANTFFARDAVSNLARWFRCSDVVAVCGKLNLVDAATGRNVDGLYWRYENFLKEREAQLGALLGANGAVYAIRRAEYAPIPGDTIIDDFVIPLQMKLRTGGRIVYDAAAVATEETPPRVADEFRRRARIGAGGFQSLARLWPLALPSAGWTALAFVSHKLLRWIAPLFLVLALAANVLLLHRLEYQALFALQAGFYAAAAIGALLPGNSTAIRSLRLATLFTSMNAALAVGFWRWLAGLQRGTWQRTAR
jgi:cellulose synthase/poly-beta-1,6-N-acetylglucosamine synthase-like glycosyltransferase